jgi:hypothetical protein
MDSSSDTDMNLPTDYTSAERIPNSGSYRFSDLPSDRKASRETIQTDLSGRVTFMSDDAQQEDLVLTRWVSIGSVKSDTVERIKKKLTTGEAKRSLVRLKQVCEKVYPRGATRAQAAGDRTDKLADRREKDMYLPLVSTYSHFYSRPS